MDDLNHRTSLFVIAICQNVGIESLCLYTVKSNLVSHCISASSSSDRPNRQGEVPGFLHPVEVVHPHHYKYVHNCKYSLLLLVEIEWLSFLSFCPVMDIDASARQLVDSFL